MVTAWRWLLAAAVVPLVIGGCTSTASRTVAGTASVAPGGHRGLSAVRHVWSSSWKTRGTRRASAPPAADPYLAKTLPRMGALLENYAIGHASADNYIAQVSGQAPTLATQADCPIWIPFPGQVVAGPYHQVLGPVQRRPRRDLRRRRPRRPGPSRQVPGALGAGHHGRAGVPGRRTDRDHLRRGHRRGRLLRRELGARVAASASLGAQLAAPASANDTREATGNT